MKKVAVAIVMLLTLTVVAFAEDGANGWSWFKNVDGLTDETIFSFGKPTVDGDEPLVSLLYLPAKKAWFWGLFRTEPWTKDQFIHVFYRFGKEPATEKSFQVDGGQFWKPIDDLPKFLTYPTIVVQPRGGDQTKYDMAGLAKTIKLAGIK